MCCVNIREHLESVSTEVFENKARLNSESNTELPRRTVYVALNSILPKCAENFNSEH